MKAKRWIGPFAALCAALWAVRALAGESVLLEFQADWCGPCRQAKPLVSRLKAEGFPIYPVNVDEHAALAQQFRIHSIPTFVLVIDGKEAERVVGLPEEQRLRQLVGQLPRQAAPQTSGETARAQNGQPPVAQPRQQGAPSRQPAVWPSRASQSESAGRATVTPVSSATVRGAQPQDLGGSAVRLIEPAPQAPSLEQAGADAQPVQPLDGSVRVSVDESGARGVGSGTIIFARPGQAIVLTCGHIFRSTRGRGAITVDVFALNNRESYQGKLLSYDLEADVGLVRIEPQTQLPAARVAPRGYKLSRGITVQSVGCSSGDPPSLRDCRITALDRYLGPPNIECTGLPVQGRSGGGLFTPEGYVIGVCTAADPSEGRGLYAGLGAIQAELDKVSLTALYDAPASPAIPAPAFASATRDTASAPAASPRAGSSPMAQPPLAVASSTPLAGAMATAGAESPPGMSHANGEGALGGLLASIGEAEVVCVVRSLHDPRGRSRVVVLDRASRDFLYQLAREHDVQQSRQLTSLVAESRPMGIRQNARLPRPALHPLLRIRGAGEE